MNIIQIWQCENCGSRRTWGNCSISEQQRALLRCAKGPCNPNIGGHTWHTFLHIETRRATAA